MPPESRRRLLSSRMRRCGESTCDACKTNCGGRSRFSHCPGERAICRNRTKCPACIRKLLNLRTAFLQNRTFVRFCARCRVEHPVPEVYKRAERGGNSNAQNRDV